MYLKTFQWPCGFLYFTNLCKENKGGKEGKKRRSRGRKLPTRRSRKSSEHLYFWNETGESGQHDALNTGTFISAPLPRLLGIAETDPDHQRPKAQGYLRVWVRREAENIGTG